LLLLRGTLGFLAVLFYYKAISLIPLSTLTLISRLHPLLGSVLAWLVLGERLRLRQLYALIVAALGTLFLMPDLSALLTLSDNSPNSGALKSSTHGCSCALLAAFITSASMLCVRKLTICGENPKNVRAIFHWANLIGSAFLGIGLQYGGPWSWPYLHEMKWILLAAFAMQVGQYFLSLTLEHEFSKGAMFFFLSVVLNTFWGILLGDPLPSGREFLGAILIVGGVVLGTSKGSVE
jgi:drug/metabolite transporter (DMT)-like permease